jgi:hypothetical protein
MKIKISENTSSHGIIEALSKFGRFSSVEFDEEKNSATNEKYIVFREVGFFEGLHRLLFKSKEELEIKRKNSQNYLYEFSKKRPEIKKFLGISILDKEYWTAEELREKLKVKAEIVRRENKNDLLKIPTSLNSKVGVIDAKSSGIKADFLIEWKIGPTKLPVGLGEIDGSSKITKAIDNRLFGTVDKDDGKTISIIHDDNPGDAEIRAAYKAALSDASGHVVIEPIYDIPISEIKEKNSEYSTENLYKICSDQSIRILLEEIDEALLKNSNINNVTIARSGTPDGRFLSRVLGQKAILNEEIKNAAESQDKNLTLMPDSLRLIKDEIEERPPVKAPELQNVELSQTKYQGVRLCSAKPEMLAADVAFLDFSSIERGATELKKSGSGQLQRVWNLSRDPGSVANVEVETILKKTRSQWNIDAFGLPACELPANKVFALQTVEGRNNTSDREKEFFMTHLKNIKGRVVIEVRAKSTLRTGLLEALEELSNRPQGLGFECILACNEKPYSGFFPNDLLVKNSTISKLDSKA